MLSVKEQVGDEWDPLHDRSGPHEHWTTTNVRENVPGVPTPLTWSLWRRASEHAIRTAAHAIGAYSAAEREVPANIDEHYSRIFYGRYALQVEYLTRLGDRLPGTSGQAVAESLLGRVPDDIEYRPTTRRYPVIAWRLPRVFVTVPGRVRAAGRATDAWYHEQLARMPGLERAAAAAMLGSAGDRFTAMVALQTTSVLGVVQPLYDALERVVARVGVGDVGVLSGSGGAEVTGLVGDLWRASRGQLELDRVAREHGFHGPLEGELSGRVWREDATPLRRLVEEYAARGAEHDPLALAHAQQQRRGTMTQELLAALPATQRPLVRLLLRLAADRIPLRGVAKRSMLQSLDVARASARRLGTLLVAEGRLDEPDDVFFLTREELSGAWPLEARELIERRRRRRAEYERLELPSDWTGMPEPIVVAEADVGDGEPITGIGVSAGVVEGIARVVLDPDFAEIEPDEILVSPTTNPSWSSIMFVSAGLVVDIGGALSHAAVVARELGLPCVVNTRSGSRRIRTGDRVRLDGAAGTVEILEHAQARAT